jgi:UDP-N-acetylglucosamine--N-acetylmuramyl-(pentapeptide) pyrophosphoryl-undecaprenol N-acetylglucosamine transferase
VTRTVLVAGGGTAGHVFPAIAVARELVRLDPEIEPVFVGVRDRLESRLVPDAGFRLEHIDAVAVPRRPSPRLLKVPGSVRAGVRRCEALIREVGAVAAVTFGGYVSFPLDRAAWRAQLPLVVHEQNSIPGLTNRMAARWADRVAVTFPSSADRFRHPERCAVTGNPVRADVLSLDRAGVRAAARQRMGLDPDLPTLLVFGGSQGARSLNRAIVDAHGHWGKHELQIVHAAGHRDHQEAATRWEAARASYPGRRVRLVDFIDDMSDAYAAADIVVCRAGATTIAELTVLGIPAVLVPYPHATADHQTENARALERAGAASMIDDAELGGPSLVAAVEPLVTDPDRYADMSRASLAFGRPDAATNVAQLVLDLIPPRSRP